MSRAGPDRSKRVDTSINRLISQIIPDNPHSSEDENQQRHDLLFQHVREQLERQVLTHPRGIISSRRKEEAQSSTLGGRTLEGSPRTERRTRTVANTWSRFLGLIHRPWPTRTMPRSSSAAGWCNPIRTWHCASLISTRGCSPCLF